MPDFEYLGLCPELLKICEENKWFLPTPVQDEAIPLILGAALLNGDFSLSIISFLGVFVSFIFGWFAIYLSNILLSNKKYWMFSIYCFSIALIINYLN